MTSETVFSKEKGLVCVDANGNIIFHDLESNFSERLTSSFKKEYVRKVEQETGKTVHNLKVVVNWTRSGGIGCAFASGAKLDTYAMNSKGNWVKVYSRNHTNM